MKSTQEPARWHIHESRDALAEAVASEVLAVVADAVAQRGSALLALPGGQTPQVTFGLIRQAALPWHAMTLVPTDERVVPVGDPLRNDALLRTAFGDLGATLLSLLEDADAETAAGLADARLQALPWSPDLIWLGMGEDGHTASLFKGSDLERALDRGSHRLVMTVRPDPLPPEAPFPRVTLTAAAILQARALLVTITGASKRTLLENALLQGANSPLPIGRLLAGAEVPVAIHWAL